MSLLAQTLINCFVRNIVLAFSLYDLVPMFHGIAVRQRLKRESGENPEQSRCCNLCYSVIKNKPLHSPYWTLWEGYDSWRKSEDLPTSYYNLSCTRGLGTMV